MYQNLQPVKVTRYWGGQEVLVLKLIDNNNLYLYRTLHFFNIYTMFLQLGKCSPELTTIKKEVKITPVLSPTPLQDSDLS